MSFKQKLPFNQNTAFIYQKELHIFLIRSRTKKQPINKKTIFLSCGAYHCVVITQDEFIDDMLNIPSSPDYRTASVSSNYYSELKAKKVSSAMANLQQNTTLSTTAEMSPIFEPKYSKSESDLKEKIQTNKFGRFVIL